jgi:adenosine deaminase
VLTAAVPGIRDHPADRLLRAGLAVTISTDARTTADTTLGHEYALLVEHFGWTPMEWRRVQDNARAAAFTAARSTG